MEQEPVPVLDRRGQEKKVLQARREQGEQSGNWEETAMAEVQSLRDIA